jgi:F0F1-type ATP synthase assembly protein I
MATTHRQDRDAGQRDELVPREYLRAIAYWAIVPGYILAGAFVGWLLDQWLGTFPYLIGVSLLVALVMAVRDMNRLKDEFM